MGRTHTRPLAASSPAAAVRLRHRLWHALQPCTGTARTPPQGLPGDAASLPCPAPAGYGELNQSEWPYWSALAVSASFPLAANASRHPLLGCGACIELQCSDVRRHPRLQLGPICRRDPNTACAWPRCIPCAATRHQAPPACCCAAEPVPAWRKQLLPGGPDH